ncbi:sugar ABC transporter substrate-binding protein [Microbacterium yannicii]|uniref:sugar ABC transporter substrate-binding protein n=1 Tax=Microbacterium yannicii TaxID=671622 RepID=UPI00031AFCFC|nr:sugar ABC transporter substrate-binding protein [Microbacterium yannicii]
MSPIRNNTKHRISRTIGVGAIALMAFGFAGCASSSDSGGMSESGDDVTIGFSVQKLTDQFQLAMIDYAKPAAEELGATLLEPVNADSDAAKQTTDIQTILTQSPDALIVGPVDADAVVPSIKRANQQDVPVVSIDQAPNGGEVFMTVRADNVGMGATGCEEMGRILEGKGTVLELQGDLSSTNGLDRSDGFSECMAEKFPDITVVQKPTDWAMDKATDAVQTVASTQQVDGIFMASDYFIPGVQKVLTSLNKWVPAGEDGHVVLIGIDGSSEALDLIRDGLQDGTVSQPANLYGQWAVEYAVAAANGETFEPGVTDHDSEIVEVETGLADLLPAPLVTKENVDDETLWGNAE